MYKKRNMRGGNATSHSAEYYGNDSGSYSTNPPAAGGSAYGAVRPVSFGTVVGNETGPNLAVYPNGSLIQTGGDSHGCGYKRNQTGGDSHGCGYKRNQTGGDSCGSHPTVQTGGDSCGSHPTVQTGGCDDCGCRGAMPKRKPQRRRSRGRASGSRRPRSGSRRPRSGSRRRRSRQSGGNHCSGSHKAKKRPSRKGKGRGKGRRSSQRRQRSTRRHHTA